MKTLMRQRDPARRFFFRSALAAILVLFALQNSGKAQERTTLKQSEPAKPQSAPRGRQAFRLHCASCHGLNGRGGEYAPDIVTSPNVRSLSDRALFRIIHDGIPRKGMPAFNLMLTPAQIREVVAFIGGAGGKPEPIRLNGNANRGERLFFGKAGCSECHMFRGKGGFLAPDLIDYGPDHSAATIREAIVDPNKDVFPDQQVVTATTRDGQQLVGIAKNEDNFSVQLLDAEGNFHLLMKSSLAGIKREKKSLMPSDYGTRLSPTEINDLVTYLAGVGH